jgi:CMP-N-acetylneuraminic acid synthetase
MTLERKKCIAIIPARGGSKRLPNKNIMHFFDKPMIAWTIESALESNIFDKIFVSTDSEEIAKVAEEYGIKTPFLRTKFADDESTVSMATVFALNQIKNCLQETYDIVAQLMPNCPLRNKEDIIKAYQNFSKSNATAQISSFKYGWMNPWWATELDSSGLPIPLFPDKLKQRSQDLPSLYCPTGAIWLGNVNEVRKANTFYTENHIFYPMTWKSAVDIDDQEDLEFAKAIYLSSR